MIKLVKIYIVKIYILSKLEEVWVKIVASRVKALKLMTDRGTTDIQVSQKLTLNFAQVS